MFGEALEDIPRSFSQRVLEKISAGISWEIIVKKILDKFWQPDLSASTQN